MPPATARLSLPLDAAAVPQARRFARQALAGAAVVPDGLDLAVTELVTNAVLHGGAPIELLLTWTDQSVLVEVTDSGHRLPVKPMGGAGSMTGRGLALLAALAEDWGVERLPKGKKVWARLTPGGDTNPTFDPAEMLAAWDLEEAEPEPHYTVRLPAVPTKFLVDAKSQVDNLVRELTLERMNRDLSEPLDHLVATVTEVFAGPREEIKRQALAAARRGDDYTDIVLRLPASAASAAREYLEALEESDRQARSARLLTLEARPADRVFRRWYLTAVIEQLNALAVGEPAPPVRNFAEVLADEFTTISEMGKARDRLQILQQLTAELAGAGTVDQMAEALVARACRRLGAETARVYLKSEDGVMRSVAAAGGPEEGAVVEDGVGAGGGRAGAGSGPAGFVATYSEIRPGQELPGNRVLETGEPMVLEDGARIGAEYPLLAGIYPPDRTLVVAPLIVGPLKLGVLSLTFSPPGLDRLNELPFVLTLADALAQALQRALATSRAAEATERLSFLADASVALSRSLSPEATIRAIGQVIVPRLANWCVIQTVQDGVLEAVGIEHRDPARRQAAIEFVAGHGFDLATSRAGEVIRTGRSELYPDIRLNDYVAAGGVRVDVSRLGIRSAMIVPLAGRRSVFGAVTLLYTESGRSYSSSDVPFAEDVARRGAVALETAQLFAAQSGRLADVIQVAMAAQSAILAPPPARLGPVALTARYVSAAAEARIGGDLYEVVSRPGAVRILIGDVKGKGLAAVRTATVVLGEFRSAAADIVDLCEVASQIDRRLPPYLEPEDFVTAVVAELRHDGHLEICSCGHPPPVLLAGESVIETLHARPGLPLGFGSLDPAAVTATDGGRVSMTAQLAPGTRLLLYTDGIIEARRPDGNFVDLETLCAGLDSIPFGNALDVLLARLRAEVGEDLGDDLALVMAEYDPPAR